MRLERGEEKGMEILKVLALEVYGAYACKCLVWWFFRESVSFSLVFVMEGSPQCHQREKVLYLCHRNVGLNT